MIRSIRYVSRDARRVLILVNPHAGAQASPRQLDQLRLRLGSSGLAVETIEDLETLGKAVGPSSSGTLRAVVAAGGDGTVAAVVNATPPGTPIAVLPSGTENLLAKYLEHPFSVDELSDTIVHGACVPMDAGRANGRLFLLMIGCGFDAHVVRRLHLQRRGHIRHTAYIKPILESVRRYDYPEMRVYCESCGDAARGSAVLRARWVFVVNIPKYAGGLRLVPRACGNDGLLDACLFERGSLVHGLRYLTGILRGRHEEWPDYRRVLVERIRIESDREVPYQLDGDPGGVLPVEIAVMPGRVNMLVSETWALRHGFRHAMGETARP